MIPWHLSTWSTNDALKALGYTHHNTGDFVDGNRIERRGVEVERFSNVFDCNDWLRSTGQVWTWAVIGGAA